MISGRLNSWQNGPPVNPANGQRFGGDGRHRGAKLSPQLPGRGRDQKTRRPPEGPRTQSRSTRLILGRGGGLHDDGGSG
jgi:hypothetical protein